MGKKAKAGRHKMRVRASGAAAEESAMSAALKEAQSKSTICPGERHVFTLSGSDGSGRATTRMCETTSIDEHETGLGPEHLPLAPLSTVIPVFMADEDHSEGKTLVQMMTLSQVQASYGDEALGATMEAFHNFTSPDLHCFVGQSPEDIYRHGLAIYLLQEFGNDPPLDKLNRLVSGFSSMSGIQSNPILHKLLDPACFEDKCRQVRCAVAIRQHTLRGRCHFTIAVALVLNATMDVWHSANMKSPGHPALTQQLRKKMSKKKAQGGPKTRCLEAVVPPVDPEDQALLDEFTGMALCVGAIVLSGHGCSIGFRVCPGGREGHWCTQYE